MELNGKRFYLAVSCDIFGIKHQNLRSPNVNSVLNLIRRFTERCQFEMFDCKCGGVSGDAYFVINGMAGASRLYGKSPRHWDIITPPFSLNEYLAI